MHLSSARRRAFWRRKTDLNRERNWWVRMPIINLHKRHCTAPDRTPWKILEERAPVLEAFLKAPAETLENIFVLRFFGERKPGDGDERDAGWTGKCHKPIRIQLSSRTPCASYSIRLFFILFAKILIFLYWDPGWGVIFLIVLERYWRGSGNPKVCIVMTNFHRTHIHIWMTRSPKVPVWKSW